jgi:adenine-specific DNA-methyltransferase
MNDQDLMTQRNKNTEIEHLDLRSASISDEKMAELMRLFPEIRTEDGKVDFERLKLALGESVDVGKERYAITWPGKADCFKTIQRPSLATLRPDRGGSVNFDETENMIIEGDNLEVLKLMQKSYLGKVKAIYIDPPYNTGNDFIYPDDFAESLQTYLEYTGQVDKQGKKFGTNTDTDGRYHSRWLNMMYPRLYLARNLLQPDGLIFMSINDVELKNALGLLNEIFGESNWLGTIVWKGATDNNPTRIAIEHEYIVCYARDAAVGDAEWKNGSDTAKAAMLEVYTRLRDQSHNDVAYIQAEFRKFVRSHGDSLTPLTHYNRIDERGPYTGSRKVHNPKPGGYIYDVVHPTTGKVCVPPVNGYRFPKATMDALIRDSRILFGDDETQIIQIKEYLADYRGRLSSVIALDSRAGANELEELFGDRKLFPHPKPAILLREILDFCVGPDDTVLDFFAGSGTTAQAVLEQNSQDQGNRKFVMVQLPEQVEPDSPAGKLGLATIADITRERVRRVIKRVVDANASQLALKAKMNPGLGFRSFKLDESNFRPWNADVPHDAETLKKQLELHVDHVRKGRTPDDLLVEILLKSGFPLTTVVENISLAKKTVHSVANGALYVCLEDKLTLDLIRAMADRKPERVVCLDQGFAGADQLKANAVQIFKAKGVTSFKTV